MATPVLTFDPDTTACARRAFNADPDAPVPGGREAVNQLASAFNEFRTAHDKKFKDLSDRIDVLDGMRQDYIMNNLYAPQVSTMGPMGWREEHPVGAGVPNFRNAETSSAFRYFCRTGDESRLNAMTTVSDPDGGYLVLPERSREMTKRLFDASPIRRISRVVTLTSAGTFEEPIDKNDATATWVNEIEERTEDDIPGLGLLTIRAEESYALVPISQTLLDDSSIDLWGWMVGKLIDKFARQEGQAFVSGTGVKQPQGFLAGTPSSAADDSRAWGTLQYVSSGSASTVTADGLIDLVYGLRAPYRTGAMFLMSSDTARIVSKLKDSNGDYLWRESFAAGQPSSLLGYPVEVSEDMPAVAASAYPVAFGNFRLGYTVVDRLGVRFLRDPYSKKPFVLVYAFRRVGGGLNNSEAIKLLKIAA